jgi:hypothetical protein
LDPKINFENSARRELHHVMKYGGNLLKVMAEKNEVGGKCGSHGGGERCAQGSSGETRGKENIGETQTQRGG